MLASKKRNALRPESLARYMARSAFLSKASTSWPSRGATAMPSDAVTTTSSPCSVKGCPSCSMTCLAATAISSSCGMPPSKIRNSSPASRASVSDVRSLEPSRSATRHSSSSPTAWPSESFTVLKLSRSRNMTATSPWPCRACSSCSSRSLASVRLGNWVSVCRWASTSIRACDSVKACFSDSSLAIVRCRSWERSHTKKLIAPRMALIRISRCKSTAAGLWGSRPIWCSTNSNTRAACVQATSRVKSRREPNMPAKIRMAGSASAASSNRPSFAAMSATRPTIRVISISRAARRTWPYPFHLKASTIKAAAASSRPTLR